MKCEVSLPLYNAHKYNKLILIFLVEILVFQSHPFPKLTHQINSKSYLFLKWCMIIKTFLNSISCCVLCLEFVGVKTVHFVSIEWTNGSAGFKITGLAGKLPLINNTICVIIIHIYNKEYLLISIS